MDILEKDLASWIAKINPYSGEVYRVEIVLVLGIPSELTNR